MNPETNDRPGVRDLFEALVDLEPDERRARVHGLSLPDDLRRKLQAMFDADRTPQPMLSMAAVDIVDHFRGDEDLVLGLIGSMVGSFRLLALIGEGGSSAVFRAERAAGSGAQTVALKLLRTGLFSVDGQRRFRREQSILAQLTHPNIAHLIEAGISDAGIPYIAMEFIDGRPITEDADARALSLRDRLRLIATLCRAIDTAHAALVVHRDLKPSNVFVTRQGALKVLDFGIAKLLDDDDGATRTQSIALTPEYAAPEQFGVGPVTVAADIYALGVLLGELLTGQRLSGSAQTRASARVLAAQENLSPPGLASREALARQLRGDLDAIIGNAIVEEPALRYRSACALADDIDCYLDRRPVRAHPPSRWYRARKFAMRHRGGVVITTVLIIGILTSLALAVWQGAVARSSAVAAKAQAARADSMRDFMFDAFAQAEPRVPRDGPATVLDAVRRAIAATGDVSNTDARARLELRGRLAQVLQAQGDLSGASELFAETLAGASHSLSADDALTLGIAEMVANNALLRGEFDAARAQFDALLSRVGSEPGELRIRLLSKSAVLASKLRQRERSLADGRKAMGLARQLGDTELLRDTLHDLGVVLLSADEVREAVSVFEEVLALNRSRFGEQHQNVANAQTALFRAYRRLGDLPRAEQAVRAALTIDRAIYAGDNWHTALHLNALMAVLRTTGDLFGALDAAREAYRLNRATLGDDHPDTVNAQYGVGNLEAMTESYATAVPLLRDALARSDRRFGTQHWETAVTRANYGFALAMSGETAAGTAQLEHAITDLESPAEPDRDMVSAAIEKRVRIALTSGNGAVAMNWIARLERDSPRAPTARASWSGNVGTLRGAALLASKHASEAVDALTRAGNVIDTATNVEPRIRVEQRLLLASAVLATGDRERASRLATQARAALKTLQFVPQRMVAVEAALPR